MANKGYMKRTFGDFSQRIQEKGETSGGGSIIVDALPTKFQDLLIYSNND